MPALSTDALAALQALPTPVLSDALVRLGLRVRLAPAGIAGPPGGAMVGRALPARHSGSVDVFLEAMNGASPGDVLVIDNGGRRDEACIGELVAGEAQAARLAGIVVWGLHRDAAEVGELGLPVFSYGTLPAGPAAERGPAEDRLRLAHFGDVTVTREDVVAADVNGVVFLPGAEVARIVDAAVAIRDAEADQITLLRAGTTLRQQLGFDDYLRARATDPSRTFRQHLRERQGAIEE